MLALMAFMAENQLGSNVAFNELRKKSLLYIDLYKYMYLQIPDIILI